MLNTNVFKATALEGDPIASCFPADRPCQYDVHQRPGYGLLCIRAVVEPAEVEPCRIEVRLVCDHLHGLHKELAAAKDHGQMEANGRKTSARDVHAKV